MATEHKEDRSCIKQGELLIPNIRSSGEMITQWIVLKKSALYCYPNKIDTKKESNKIELKFYQCIEDKRKSSNHIYLKAKQGNYLHKIEARTFEDKKQWMSQIEQVLYQATYGTTVKINDKVESACVYWFFILSVGILVYFAVIYTLQSDQNTAILLNAICIPLSLYQFAIILLCFYYILQLKIPLQQLKQIIVLDQFWITASLSFVYNICTFIFLFVHLCMNPADGDKVWFWTDLMIFLFGSISIPLPAICIKIHCKFKYDEHASKRHTGARSISRNSRVLTGSRSQSIKSVSVQKTAHTALTNGTGKATIGYGSSLISTGSGTPNPMAMTGGLLLAPEIEYSYKPGFEGVKFWLKNTVQLPEYIETFEKQKINDMTIVLELTFQDLEEMQVKIGDRKRIMGHIDKMKPKVVPKVSHSLNVESISSMTMINASRPIFKNNIIKGLICSCYLIQLCVFICFPFLKYSHYYPMNRFIYPNYRFNGKHLETTILFNLNEIFLRNFMAITIISVLSIFVTELIDKRVIISDYWQLYALLKEKLNRAWIIIISIMILALPLEFFGLRNLIRKQMNVVTDLDMSINLIWIFLMICAIMICCVLLCQFSGIYHKAHDHYDRLYQFQKKSPKSPIKTFVFECCLYLAFFMAYIILIWLFIIKHGFDEYDQRSWDIMRQSVILALLWVQFFTLIRVKQFQKFPDASYLNSYKKRMMVILHG